MSNDSVFSKKFYTINAICGLIRNQKEAKEALCPYGDIAPKEVALEIVKDFCIAHNLAFDPSHVPSHEQYDPDWGAVYEVARVICVVQ